ncbi:MAG: MOSC domain-containing protein [Saprospiraceae bacterium]
MATSLRALFETLPQQGKVKWIGIRPGRRKDLQAVESVEVNTRVGLLGDHYSGQSGNRQVTLIQAEHLTAVAGMLGKDAPIDPLLTRRNIVVEGINLLALQHARFKIGDVVLETTGPCEPCSRMEENLGAGGYNAMRGHGGICARVVEGGHIQVGDAINFLELVRFTEPEE